jgi:spore coat-associated protein N
MVHFGRRVRREGARGRALVRLALWVTAVVVLTNTVVFSSASFTSNRTTNPGNVFSGGTLLLLNTKDGQVLVGATALRPGQTQQGTLTLTNAGSVQGDCAVEGVGLSDVPGTPALSDVLTMTITDLSTGTIVWTGAMGTFTSASLGLLAPGEGRQYRVAVAFPAAATDRALQGAQTTLTLRFSGVSL